MHSSFNTTEFLVFMLKNFEGDPFQSLTKLCMPVIINSIENRYIRGFDRDDFLQEAKIALVNAVKSYKFETDLRFVQYYSLCLENHLNMLIRKDNAKKRLATKESTSLEEMYEANGYETSSKPSTNNPEQSLIAKETYKNYLFDLSDFERRAFVHYLMNTPYDKIAEILECEKAQVQNAIYRCSKKLKDLVKYHA